MRRVAPSDPALRHRGWCDRRDPSSTGLAWAGTGVALRFRGTGVSIELAGAGMLEALLDGSPLHLLGPSMPSRLSIASDLPDREHVVEIRKRTEPVAGTVRFQGFVLPDGAVTLPPGEPAPHLLFLGDSITCGYGNLAPGPEHGFEPQTEDVFRAFAGIACDRLGVGFQACAWSGKGLQRNFDRDGNPTIADLWRLADPNDPQSVLHAPERPLACVVNLGSNDVFHDDPDWPSFQRDMVALGEAVRTLFPALPLVLVDGPLLSDAKFAAPDGSPRPLLTLLRHHLDAAASTLDASGPAWRFSLEPCDPAEPYGADFHPSPERHRLGGESLADFLRDRLPASGSFRPL